MSLSLADELCKIISKAQLLYVKKRLANAVQKNITDFFNAKLINNKELSLNILLHVSICYTCYCSIMLLLWNCIIVCHMVLELYRLYCYDLYWPLNNLSSCEIKAWKKFRPEQDSNPYHCSSVYGFLTADLSVVLEHPCAVTIPM